jgi:N-acetylmuramoyl-L-alanine amidase
LRTEDADRRDDKSVTVPLVRGRILIALSVLLAACGVDDEVDGVDAGVSGVDAGQDIGPPVGEVVDLGCSTEVVLGLSLQIADEIACMSPDALAPFAQGDGIVFDGAAVLPYVSRDGLEDLREALRVHGGEVRINSGFRTVVQQYLLHQWFLGGTCGITAAATPGRSNHESGRALDLGNYQDWADILPTYGWEQTVLPNDPVHFDHLGSADNRGLDVLAFQRLWNRNRENDAIDEDGDYGPQTAARIEMSPAGGFAYGAECSSNLRIGEVTVLGDPANLDTGAQCAH